MWRCGVGADLWVGSQRWCARAAIVSFRLVAAVALATLALALTHSLCSATQKQAVSKYYSPPEWRTKTVNDTTTLEDRGNQEPRARKHGK